MAFSSRGREDTPAAHRLINGVFSGCVSLIARLMGLSAATPELRQAGGARWLAAELECASPSQPSCILATSTTLPLQHNPCTARLSPDYPHLLCLDASPVPTTAPTSSHRRISPTIAIPKDSQALLRHLQRRVEISLLPNPPIPVVAHPPEPAANYFGNLFGDSLGLLLMLTLTLPSSTHHSPDYAASA